MVPMHCPIQSVPSAGSTYPVHQTFHLESLWGIVLWKFLLNKTLEINYTTEITAYGKGLHNNNAWKDAFLYRFHHSYHIYRTILGNISWNTNVKILWEILGLKYSQDVYLLISKWWYMMKIWWNFAWYKQTIMYRANHIHWSMVRSNQTLFSHKIWPSTDQHFDWLFCQNLSTW